MIVSSIDQTESPKGQVRCGICQHSVLVRGLHLVACLTHLDMRDPAQERICDEFEPKPVKSGSESDKQSGDNELLLQ